jgi:hypothetical protein
MYGDAGKFHQDAKQARIGCKYPGKYRISTNEEPVSGVARRLLNNNGLPPIGGKRAD